MESFKQPESIEPISRQEVVASLTADVEDLSILQKYLDQREKEVQNNKDALNLNVELAEIYRDAGLKEIAIEAYQQAAQQAWQEGEDELSQRMTTESEKLIKLISKVPSIENLEQIPEISPEDFKEMVDQIPALKEMLQDRKDELESLDKDQDSNIDRIKVLIEEIKELEEEIAAREEFI